MKNGKSCAVIVCLFFSLMVSSTAMASFGSIVDFFFNSAGNTVYIDHLNERPVDTTFLYEKFSDYYCIEAFGQELCGYDCQPGDTHSDCATSEYARCVKNDYGVVTCGYGCQVSGHDMQCGVEPNDACLKDALGRITCGKDCHCYKGQTVCGADNLCDETCGNTCSNNRRHQHRHHRDHARYVSRDDYDAPVVMQPDAPNYNYSYGQYDGYSDPHYYDYDPAEPPAYK